MISPDEDFLQAGHKSGIEYSKSFEKYKQILIKGYETPTYQRIFAEFNAALFGKVRVFSDNFIADDGDYDAEIEAFKNDLRAEEMANAEEAVDAETPLPTPSLPSSPSLPSPPLPSSPTPSLQSDHWVSISVTSHISHTTVASSSRVSTIVNNPMPPP